MRTRKPQKPSSPKGPPAVPRSEPALPEEQAETPKLSTRRRWAFRILAATLVPALVLGLLEIGLRVFGFGYDPHFFMKAVGREGFEGNPKFGWRFFPPAVARMPELFTVPTPKPAGTYRIFVLGGSAAQGDPDPSLGFARILDAMLREALPERKFEVVNAAMVAINSHVVLQIARECAEKQGDLFVVYMGNNEVVGPFGAGTVFERFTPSLSMIRTGVAMERSRFVQLLGRLRGLFSGNGESINEWKGMEFFLGNRIAADDPKLESVYGHFRQNLLDICKVASAHGAAVLVCTVGVNLKDCPPFAAMHREDLTEADKARWETLYEAGNALCEKDRCSEAIEQYAQAAALDDRHADLHYRMGQCRAAVGDFEHGRDRFAEARDLDTLRFRADRRINDIIRETAAAAGETVSLVDIERLFGQAAGVAGLPGDDLFHDHVHINFAGNYVIAKAVFERVWRLLPADGSGQATADRAAPSLDRCAELAGLSGWDRARLTGEMIMRMTRPPFTQQIDHERKIARLRLEEEALRIYKTPEGLQQCRELYEQAIAAAPNDADLHRNFAMLLAAMGDFASAERHLRTVLDRFPDDVKARIALGGVLVKQRRLDDAAKVYTAAFESPRCDRFFQSEAHFNWAIASEAQDKPGVAVEHYRAALELSPNQVKTHTNLGLLFRRRGDLEQAAHHLSKVVQLDPDLALGHFNLALVQIDQGRLDRAAQEFREVLRLQPDNAAVYVALGQVYARLEKLVEAIESFETALKLAPSSAEAHSGLGTALMKQDRVDEAIAHFTAVVALKPEDATARRDLEAARARQASP